MESALIACLFPLGMFLGWLLGTAFSSETYTEGPNREWIWKTSVRISGNTEQLLLRIAQALEDRNRWDDIYQEDD